MAGVYPSPKRPPGPYASTRQTPGGRPLLARAGYFVDWSSAFLGALDRLEERAEVAGAEAAVEGMGFMDELGVISVQEMHAQLAAA